MLEANKKFLEDNIKHLNSARDGFMRGIGQAELNRMQEIMGQEFRPGYTADLTCPHCVLEMVKILAIHYQQWRDAQPVIVEANFPKHDKPE